MQNINRQRGMTVTGWLVVVLIIGIFAAVGMKIGPVYLQNYTVKNILESLKDEPLITQKTPGMVTNMIMRRLDINGVYDLSKKNITIKKSPGIMQVSIDYNVQKQIIGNLEALMTFSDKIELVSN